MGLKEVSSGVELDGAKDLELSDLLTLTVSSSILNSLRSCLGSGQAMMARLESEYNRKDVGSKYAVLAQLLSYRYKGLGIRKHCDDVIQLMNELSDKGVTLDSDIMVCILLYSMPAEFSTFVTTVSGQNESALSVDVVRIRAISEEARLRGNETDQVLFSSNKLPNDQATPLKRKGAKKVVKCFNCRKIGHMIKECPDKKEVVALACQMDVDEVPVVKKVKVNKDPGIADELLDWDQLEALDNAKKSDGKTKIVNSSLDSKNAVDLNDVLEGMSWEEALKNVPGEWSKWKSAEKLKYCSENFKLFGSLTSARKLNFKNKLFPKKGEKEKVLVGSKVPKVGIKTSHTYLFVIDSGATFLILLAQMQKKDGQIEKLSEAVACMAQEIQTLNATIKKLQEQVAHSQKDTSCTSKGVHQVPFSKVQQPEGKKNCPSTEKTPFSKVP
jgi:hypothetical protein